MNQVAEFEFTDEMKAKAANNTATILGMLRDRPHYSNELAEVTHRFSACIHNLREAGHRITVDQDKRHTWHGCDELVRVTDEMKAAYYETRHWKNTRANRLAVDDYQCCHCHGRDTLHVHHWYYELFAERVEDLMTLCQNCHEAMHKNDAIKVHFPHFVTAEIAKRIADTAPRNNRKLMNRTLICPAKVRPMQKENYHRNVISLPLWKM